MDAIKLAENLLAEEDGKLNNVQLIRELGDTPSFAGRRRLLEKHRPRRAAGSSRIVYFLDDDWAIKLAKNNKGLAQNEAANDGYLQGYDIVPQIDQQLTDSDDRWLVVERAERITPAKFARLAGVSFKDYKELLWVLKAERDRGTHHADPRIKQMYDDYWEDDDAFFSTFRAIAVDMGYPLPGDFSRISSYGEVNGRLVITDWGLSEQVMKEHYSG